MSVISEERLLTKLEKKPYRDAYVREHVKTSVPLQIRHLREQREWTQALLAQRAKTTQTVISRLEDPNYGNLSLNSLLKIAAAFDIGLLVKFVPFSRLLAEFHNLSPQAVSAQSFGEELPRLKRAATQTDHAADSPRTSQAKTEVSRLSLEEKALGRDRRFQRHNESIIALLQRSKRLPEVETEEMPHETLSSLACSAHSTYGSE